MARHICGNCCSKGRTLQPAATSQSNLQLIHTCRTGARGLPAVLHRGSAPGRRRTAASSASGQGSESTQCGSSQAALGRLGSEREERSHTGQVWATALSAVQCSTYSKQPMQNQCATTEHFLPVQRPRGRAAWQHGASPALLRAPPPIRRGYRCWPVRLSRHRRCRVPRPGAAAQKGTPAGGPGQRSRMARRCRASWSSQQRPAAGAGSGKNQKGECACATGMRRLPPAGPICGRHLLLAQPHINPAPRRPTSRTAASPAVGSGSSGVSVCGRS